MRTCAKLIVGLTLLALLPLTGCNKLKARDELNKGVRAYKAANFEGAVEHFRKAIDYDPNLLNARIYLATAYASQYIPGHPSEENKRNAEQAIKGFEDVLERDPNNVTALSYLASLYFGMGGSGQKEEEIVPMFEKSKEYRRRLIQVDPQNPEHYYSIGVIDWTICYRRNQELRATIRGLQPDQPLPPRDRRQLAEKNSALVEEGLQMLHKAIDLNPKYLHAIAYLNLMYRQKADLVESASEREQMLQQADDYFQRHEKLREEQMRQPAATPAQ